MSNEIDWKAALDGTKPVTTRDGRKVTLYCIDAPGEYPVHGRVEDWLPDAWRLDGTNGSAAPEKLDLIQPKVKHTITGWLNVYNERERPHRFYENKRDADFNASSRRLACVPVTITYTEGEGLD